MGRALIDAAFGVTIERRFAARDQRSVLAERWLAALHRAIQVLARDETLTHSHDMPDLGDLAITVGLSYIEFRLPEVIWRDSASRLALWMDGITTRPSMRLTEPS
jgi:glutathione S-transferase